MTWQRGRPLGATPGDRGTEFAVWSDSAERIELVLYDERGENETARHTLTKGDDGVHALVVAEAGPGTRYGLRAHGPYHEAAGNLFDPSKLLVDPYALTIDRPYRYDPRLGEVGADTANLMPKAIVTLPPAAAAPRKPAFRPGGLIYELPVKAFSMLNPAIPAEMRGTIAALGHSAALDHLRGLNVSAVELMPITAWIDERHLPPLGLSNAWGYNPVTYLALDPRLAPGGIGELRVAVEALHGVGIDVFLDVVFNHTGESDADGPTLSLRGLDNAAFYRHAADDPGLLVNDTGCGNTLACDRPPRRMILDAMRHFVLHAGVDGFRFDLATTLGRSRNGYSAEAALFAEMRSDPVLADRILIAEPWDIGPGGYQLGNFPPPFLEWNDRYRDDVRRFWRGDEGMIGAFVTRLSGSSDIFRKDGEPLTRSVDFIAAHDGFSLADIVAYEHKHNEENGEDNRDGHDENYSWNNGVEGHSDDEQIRRNRRRDLKALIATLLVSRGTVMLTAGDEFGHSRRGNNNAYAQDNAANWLDWPNRDIEIETHTAQWSALRARIPALRSAAFLDGKASGEEAAPDVVWLHPQGRSFAIADWLDPDSGAIAMVLAADESDPSIRRVAVLLNRTATSVDFALPKEQGWHWRRGDGEGPTGESRFSVASRSLALVVETAD